MKPKYNNTEHTCEICKKNVSTMYHPEWAYKDSWKGRVIWFCGYPHMREWQKAHGRL